MPPDDRTRFFEEMPANVTRQLLEVLTRYSSRIDANVGITGTQLRLAVVFGRCFLTFPKRIIRNPTSGHQTTLGKNALACRAPPMFSFRNPDVHPGTLDDLKFRDPRSGFYFSPKRKLMLLPSFNCMR